MPAYSPSLTQSERFAALSSEKRPRDQRDKDIPVDEYLTTTIVRAKEFAPVMIDLQVAISEDREIKFECSEAVTSWITILDLDGNAIKGAEISRLDVTDRHGTRFVLEPPGIKLLYPAIKKSDADGKLILPQMPDGGKITCKIIHPNWMPANCKQTEISRGEIDSLVMQSGTPVTLKFVGEDNI